MNTPPENSPKLPPRRWAQLQDLLIHGVGVRSLALTVLMLLGVLYTVYFAKAVILPVVLALILSMVLAPAVRWIHLRLRLPVAVASALILFGFVAALGLGSVYVVGPASAWIQTIPERIPEIKSRLVPLQKPLEQVKEASQQMEKLAELNKGPNEQVVKIRESPAITFLVTQTPGFFANLLVMFILLYFMLASGDLFLRKLVRMIPTFEDKRHAVEIFREIEARVSRYLGAVTLINLALGISIGAAAYLVGMPNFLLWGVLAFVLNYIPYVGAFLGICASFIVGLLTFESTAYAFVMPGIYFAANVLEGNLVTPIVVGRILTLNPVMVFISLMFWSWIWGIAGALLAVPILAIVKIVCDHLRPLAPIGEFVGGEVGEDRN